MHQPEEACSPGVATRLAKRRSMDGAVPSTPPSSGKGKRRDALVRLPRRRLTDAAADVPAGSSGATDEEMHDRSFRESRSVSSDDADAREDIAAVAREAAVDRKVRVPSARQTPPLSIDDSVSETRERERTKHARRPVVSPRFVNAGGRNRETRGRFFFFVFREMFSGDPDARDKEPPLTHLLTTSYCLFTTHDRRHRNGMTRRRPRRSRGSWGTRNARFSYGRTVSRFPVASATTASPTRL